MLNEEERAQRAGRQRQADILPPQFKKEAWVPGACTDCGAPTSGVRCRADNGRHQAIQAALALEDADEALLTMRADGLSADRIALRLNVSRNRVYQKVRAARRRERLRQSMLKEGT